MQEKESTTTVGVYTTPEMRFSEILVHALQREKDDEGILKLFVYAFLPKEQ